MAARIVTETREIFEIQSKVRNPRIHRSACTLHQRGQAPTSTRLALGFEHEPQPLLDQILELATAQRRLRLGPTSVRIRPKGCAPRKIRGVYARGDPRLAGIVLPSSPAREDRAIGRKSKTIAFASAPSACGTQDLSDGHGRPNRRTYHELLVVHVVATRRRWSCARCCFGSATHGKNGQCPRSLPIAFEAG